MPKVAPQRIVAQAVESSMLGKRTRRYSIEIKDVETNRTMLLTVQQLDGGNSLAQSGVPRLRGIAPFRHRVRLVQVDDVAA